MFVKLFGTIVSSSIWEEDFATRLVWITLLVTATKEGFVRTTEQALARTSNVPLKDTLVALEILQNPDETSGSPEDDGRRIEKVQGGYMVLNLPKYRSIKTAEQLASAESSKRHYYKEKAKKEIQSQN